MNTRLGLPENDHRASGKVRGGSAPAASSARLESGTPRLEAAGHITASALHSWVLDNVRPLADAAIERQGDAARADVAEARGEFLLATGIHRGVIQVETKLLELLTQMYAAERAAEEAATG